MKINIWIILSLILFLFIGIFYFLIYRPLEQEKANLLESIETNRQTLIKYQASYKKLLEEWDKFRIALQRYAELQEKLPVKEDLPRLLIHVEKISKESKLKINSFRPLPSNVPKTDGKTPTPYEEYNYSIDMEGSYGSFLLFLSKIKTAPRLILIKNLKINPLNTEASLLKYNFILSTFITR
ncbi:MAG: type 4a pilus biogenesis protein PilO [Dictyoglomaceae bacterium]|nr:type 4a pilus biogenesis protein PilO [Dictyoglomaceae bacterium]